VSKAELGYVSMSRRRSAYLSVFNCLWMKAKADKAGDASSGSVLQVNGTNLLIFCHCVSQSQLFVDILVKLESKSSSCGDL
jgi:hypothetical protein